MPREIFISYKYSDKHVPDLRMFDPIYEGGPRVVPRETRVRDYVDTLQDILKAEGHINLGEKDGESLADFKDDAIETSLKKKIFGTSVTIVMISKGMKEVGIPERDQWVPWEISYSLRTTSRSGLTSRMNAILGVVLPDKNNSYDWYYTYNPSCKSTTHHTDHLFEMLSANMFNRRKSDTRECNGTTIHEGEFSYIRTVKWSDFINSSNSYIEIAIAIRDKSDEYDLKIQLN